MQVAGIEEKDANSWIKEVQRKKMQIAGLRRYKGEDAK